MKRLLYMSIGICISSYAMEIDLEKADRLAQRLDKDKSEVFEALQSIYIDPGIKEKSEEIRQEDGLCIENDINAQLACMDKKLTNALVKIGRAHV